MSSCVVVIEYIQELQETFFKYKNAVFNVEQDRKRIYYLCEDRIEKSVPHDHQLSSLCKPCDAKQ